MVYLSPILGGNTRKRAIRGVNRGNPQGTFRSNRDSEMAEEAHDESHVVYFFFRYGEVGISFIVGAAENVAIALEDALDDNALSCVEDMNAAPLDESRLSDEAAGELVARLDDRLHGFASGDNSEVVFGQGGNDGHLLTLAFRHR